MEGWSLKHVCPVQVVLLGIDILSALVSRLQDRFKAQIGTGKGLCASGGRYRCSVGICSGCCTHSLLSPQESIGEALGGSAEGWRVGTSIAQGDSSGTMLL